jgi:anti-anti-sigma factor
MTAAADQQRLLFIGYDNGGAAHLVRLRGTLDARTAGRLAALLGDLRRSSRFDIVVDVAAIASCDSAALATLVRATRELRLSGRRLLLQDPAPCLRDAMRAAQAHQELEVAQTSKTYSMSSMESAANA